MKLSAKALASSCALIWGGCVLLVGLVHIVVPSYGVAFLSELSSVYPGFRGSGTFTDVLFGTGEAVIDGAIGGLVFGWLYNVILYRVEARAELAGGSSSASGSPYPSDRIVSGSSGRRAAS